MAGSMRSRGNGSYLLEYMYKGKRYNQTIKANSDHEASMKLALFVSEINKGNFCDSQKMTFVELAQLFLDKYAIFNLSKKTYDDYKNRFNKYILDSFGRMKISEIKRIHIQEFSNNLVAEYNLSSKTAKNYIKLISSVFNRGVEWGLVEYNPAEKVKVPRNPNKQQKKVVLYSYEELSSFLAALENLENKELQMAIQTSINTGARRGEVLALTFNDFNFDRCSIDFNKSIIAVENGTQLKDTKTGKNRQFYVSQKYIDLVSGYYKMKGYPDKSSFLFSMHPDTYSKLFKKFLRDNNLRVINLKDLRALHESILINKGMDIVAVAKRLGHLPSTAINYYLDQIPEEDKKASKILDQVLS